MKTMRTRFTRSHYEQLPEGFPAQLIDGCLVHEAAPTYRHQAVVMSLLRRLMPLVAPGLLIPSPTDVAVDDHNVFQPDIVVLDHPPARPDRSYVGTPRLVLEVLSPSTAGQDRGVKARKLLGLGVEEVWLVDPDERTVERRTRREVLVAEGREILASEVVSGFEVVPEDLLRGHA